MQNNTGDMASEGAFLRGWCQAHPKLLYILSQVAASIHTPLVSHSRNIWKMGEGTSYQGLGNRIMSFVSL